MGVEEEKGRVVIALPLVPHRAAGSGALAVRDRAALERRLDVYAAAALPPAITASGPPPAKAGFSVAVC